MRSIELFAGAGGLALGLEKSGWHSQLLIERNTHACNTLRLNAAGGQSLTKNWHISEADVTTIDYSAITSPIDLVAGGPPCQPFSLGGKHNGREDKRDMFPEAIRAVRELRPKYFLFENVKGLLRQSFAEYFNYIVLRLRYPYEEKRSDESWQQHAERLIEVERSNCYEDSPHAYRLTWQLVDAADYGVPQHRHRVIIVGVREDLGWEFEFPLATHGFDQLVVDKYLTGSYWAEYNMVPVSDSEIHRSARTRLAKISGIPPALFEPKNSLERYATVYDAIHDLPKPLKKGCKEVANHFLQTGAKAYPGHTGSPLHFPSKAIKAGDHGVPGGENMIAYLDKTYRYFSTREAARIQTFPDNYIFTGSWGESMRQIGNAVPVKLGRVMGRALYEQATANTVDVKQKRPSLQSAGQD
ncbi:MAG: DNA cytosine methyltransferase [Saprospiraceae bacterium]